MARRPDGEGLLMTLNGSSLLGGLCVPVVTGLTEDGAPDVAANAPFLTALADAGVYTVMLLGSNGEGPLLPTSELEQYLIDICALWRDLVDDAVILVNATSAGTRDAVDRAGAAVRAGADAVVSSAPFYFGHTDEEILRHFDEIGTAGLPVVVYNIPRYAGPLTGSVISQLGHRSHVVGAKDSSGDLEVLRDFIAIKRERPDFGVSQGAETLLLAGLQEGADGIVPGTANIAPGLALELLEGFRAGNLTSAERCQDLLTALTGIHKIHRGVPSVKAILKLRGLLEDCLAPPLSRCTAEERRALATFLAPYDGELIGSAPTPRP